MTSLRRISPCFGFIVVAAALYGCAADRPGDVPAGANMQNEGNQRLVYTAPSSGQVWVTDVGSNSVVYAGPVHSGDEVAVDPDNNRVTIAGQVVATHDVGHENHRIFFAPGMSSQTATDTAGRDIQRPADVPAAASLAGEGANRVSYTAERAGTVWVVDVDHNSVIYRGRVNRTDELVIDPDHNNLTVNGNKVNDQNLNNSERRIFFLPATESAIAM